MKSDKPKKTKPKPKAKKTPKPTPKPPKKKKKPGDKTLSASEQLIIDKEAQKVFDRILPPQWFETKFGHGDDFAKDYQQ